MCFSNYGERKKSCLGVLCGLQYHGGGQVEDAVDALDRRPDGGGVEEVHLEQPEPRVRAIQSLQVLGLALVLCKISPVKQYCFDPIQLR